MGTDLGRVRLHSGTEPAALNDMLGARAFTADQDIFLRDGAPDTSSSADQHLIAHEVARTVQQSGVRRIRRLPTWNTVKQLVGDPKTGKNLVTRRSKSKDYKVFGAKLTAYGNVTNVVIAQNGGTRAQDYLAIVTALDDVRGAAATYNATHTSDERARMIAGIGDMVIPEKAILKTRKNFYDANPPNGVQQWNEVLPTSLGTQVHQLDEGPAGGQQQGGINTTTEYDFGKNGINFDTYYKEAEDQLRQGTPEYLTGTDQGSSSTTSQSANAPRSQVLAEVVTRMRSSASAASGDMTVASNVQGAKASIPTSMSSDCQECTGPFSVANANSACASSSIWSSSN